MMVAGSGGRRRDHDWRVLQFSSLSQGSQPQIHHPHIGCHHTELASPQQRSPHPFTDNRLVC